MAEQSQLEHLMDEFVMLNLPWQEINPPRKPKIEYRGTNGNWVSDAGDIDEGRDYRIGFQVKNIGSETYAKNVQIRVVNEYPARVTFFTDSTYSHVDSNQHVNSDLSGLLAPGELTDWHWVYFRVRGGPNERMRKIFQVGVYAEIVPQGHYWGEVKKALGS